ncbi:MAG: hypothetical protein Q9174_002867, partial [Haloplaca sp. 1 TL-2023]
MSSFFGQNNNQQSSGFGGFGSNNNSGSGFGQSSNTGFGATSGTSGGGLFGTSNNNNTSGGFGGFGATNSNTSTPFGGSTGGFGANTSSGGGLFGGNASASGNTGFGGFGGGSSNTGGGLFGGGNKPAFGAQQPTTGSSLFGGGTSSFGASNTQTASGFGAPASTALGAPIPECQGTGSTPFQAFTEKEGSGNQTNHYQSVAFMQPYKNYSFEELRLADYNQGRRYGNGSGQAGAFGTSTGFGGFGGQSTGSGFGNNNTQGSGLFGQANTAAPFGGGQTATTGFGSNTTGGLFGSKPSGGFGATSSQPTTGGLFGSSNQSTGFGAQNNTTGGFGQSNQSGGLFGNNNNNNNQQKSGFSFGQNSNNTTGGFGSSGNTGFGANNNSNTGGGLFGSNSGSTPFGGGQQQQPASNPFGGFGSNQQNQTQNNTGSAFGGGFGNNDQQKAGGLFGNTNTSNTGGGLFGNNNQNNQQNSSTGGGLFGAANNSQTGGSSLFGAKPAAPGGGLFGSNTTTNTGNTGGGLFGNNNNNQQTQGGGLFGSTNNQQQQKPGGLFGGGSGGNSLFGGNNNTNNQQQQGGSSLFGNTGANNQQQQSGGLFGASNNNTSSLFNNSQQQAQQQQVPNPLQAPQAYTASIFDANPYGNRSIFDGLPPPPQQYTGPVATPIGQKNKANKSAILPQYRINPQVASRFVTPQKRPGYGFTYSTYGTPSSASSNVSTPGGLGSSLLHGSISRSLGKSLSTNNLRRAFDQDQESLLSPGAFSAGSSRYGGSGSLKKLVIDRSLRTDLFQSPAALPSTERIDQSRQPGILKKKVSFDASTVGGNGGAQNEIQSNGVNGHAGSAPENSRPQQSAPEPAPSTQSKGPANGVASQPEMEQVRGNELAVINEDGNHDRQNEDSSSNAAPTQYDPQPGAYYMRPSRDEIKRMSADQKRAVSNFCIGREGCGFVVFDVPVDLTKVDMDHIFGEIAVIELRSLTIYPVAERKPTRGKGLNVPSTIHLANSWPRARDRQTPLFEKSGPRYQKHINRLQRVRDTQFVSYDKDTGTWVFKVQHFTTYALEYDDQGSEGDTFASSTLSDPPESSTPQSRVAKAGSTPMPSDAFRDSSMMSSEISQESSGPDDTFEFRRKKFLPGAFDDSVMLDEQSHPVPPMSPSFSDSRPASSVGHSEERSPSPEMDYQNGDDSVAVHEDQLDMAGSFPQVDGGSEERDLMPKSILKSTQTGAGFGTPGKLQFNDSGDWAEELCRTISPKKQDRQALRESQARVMHILDEKNDTTPKARKGQKPSQPGFATTMDLMDSIFPKEQQNRRMKGSARKTGQGKAFQYPYPKTLAANDGKNGMSEKERQWHDSFKPSWAVGGTLLYAIDGGVGDAHTSSVMHDLNTKIVSEGRDVRLAKFTEDPSFPPQPLLLQQKHTSIEVDDRGIPYATSTKLPLREFAAHVETSSRMEKSVWDLASVLFDDLDPAAFGTIPAAEQQAYAYRVRKDLLSKLWSQVCVEQAQKAVSAATTAEERAIGYLSANALVRACQTLLEAHDFRLATLVSQLPADGIMANDMAKQIQEWGKLNALSEFSEPIRALYEICAGNVCVCEGKKGAIEDRIKPFVISQRFHLDWQRAFGLRLWFGTKADDPIEAAVKKFSNDVTEGKEPVKPLAPFQSSSSDEESTSPPNDIRWGLLELFAASKGTSPPQSLLDITTPQSTVGNPLDYRLSFQLYTNLSHYISTNDDKQHADILTLNFASQLELQNHWTWSIFILLHLSSPPHRTSLIQELLARNAPHIAIPGKAFHLLTTDFKIPESWIYTAKALEARSLFQNFASEITYLQKAGDWNTAHERICGVVAP